MNPLHTALLDLFGQDAQLAQDLANAPAYTLKERACMAAAHSRRLLPTPPKGRQHFRYSFWGKFKEKLVMRWAFIGSAEKQAECALWLEAQKRKAAKWPPASIFSPITHLPQPRTGRD